MANVLYSLAMIRLIREFINLLSMSFNIKTISKESLNQLKTREKGYKSSRSIESIGIGRGSIVRADLIDYGV